MNSKVKVAYVSRVPPYPCGVAEYTSFLLKELKASNYIDFVVLAEVGEGYSFGSTLIEEYSGVEVRVCFSKGDLNYLTTCIDSEGQLNLVHIQHEFGIFPHGESLILFLHYLKKSGIRTVVTLHSVIHTRSNDFDKLGTQAKIAELADAIVVHSILQEYELYTQGIPWYKVHRIPHGTLLNPFIGCNKRTLVKDLGLDHNVADNFIILVPGFLRIDRDWANLINAYKELAKEYDTVLAIVGYPRLISIYESIETELVKAPNVILKPMFIPREELLKWFAISDLVVLPYRASKYGYSVSGIFHLAIGSRKPVVCTREYRLVECYMLAPELTLQDLTAKELYLKIKDVIENYRYFDDVVKRLWIYAQETSWSNVAHKHVELYQKILFDKHY